jgi:outer membrane protein OmpA-like peptidoglycan-associated protein
MRRLMIVLLISATASLSSACVATKKFVRGEVKTSSDTLGARIDTNEGSIKEAHDGISRVDGRVTGLDGRVTGVDEKVTGLKGDVENVDRKADHAASMAEQAGTEVSLLDEKFQNRNHFTVANQTAVTFRFDSAKLDSSQQPALDSIAEMLAQNPDAVLILEGRTDSAGNSDYNIKLGERRMEAVRRYLAVEKGVPVYKIHQISFGAAQPIADNKSREGREKNRAVAMTILVPRVDTVATSSQQ